MMNKLSSMKAHEIIQDQLPKMSVSVNPYVNHPMSFEGVNPMQKVHSQGPMRISTFINSQNSYHYQPTQIQTNENSQLFIDESISMSQIENESLKNYADKKEQQDLLNQPTLILQSNNSLSSDIGPRNFTQFVQENKLDKIMSMISENNKSVNQKVEDLAKKIGDMQKDLEIIKREHSSFSNSGKLSVSLGPTQNQ